MALGFSSDCGSCCMLNRFMRLVLLLLSVFVSSYSYLINKSISEYYSCCCCCKHRQKRSPTKQMTRQGQITQPPNTYTVYEVANNETNSNINNVHQARPWNIINNHTSRVTPTSTSPLNNVQHPTSTAQSESYIFGNRHTSKSNEQ